MATRGRIVVTTGSLLLALLWFAYLPPRAAAASSSNSIQLENAKPGTTDWQIPGGPSSAVQGYASENSVQPGDVLHLHVSAGGNARYRIEIYRLGWYGGDGGRRVACLPSCSGGKPGRQWPVPQPNATTGELDAGWPVTDAITVGSHWTSGYYLAKLVLTSGRFAGQASSVFFVVKAPAGSTSSILVQASVNTWEAYNSWGGKSLYSFNSTNDVAATMVSFNRPLLGEGDDSSTSPLTWEYPLVRFLEREGYDVSYQTDVDTDEDPGSLLSHRLNIVSGHDEYWSGAIRSAFDQARDSGVNLAFVGADIGYWQLRYADSDRTLIEYRSASADPDPDPSQKTVAFRQLSPPLPECELLGVGYDGGLEPSVLPANYTVQGAAGSSGLFAGTSLAPGDQLINAVGYEWDGIEPGCATPPLQDLLHGEANNRPADAVRYQAPSGARVFSDGTLNLTWALDDYSAPGGRADARVQRLFSGIFDDLGGGAPGRNPEPLAPRLETPPVGSTRVTFRWSGPAAAAYDHFVLVLDGRPAATVPASSCVRGTCAVALRLHTGRHRWLVDGYDALGNSLQSAKATLTAKGPAVVLASPGPRAELWNPAPSFSWRLAYAAGARARYVVQIDSRRFAVGRRAHFKPAGLLRDGWHRWAVEAILGGGRRWSHTYAFRIASVRVLQSSLRTRLPRGLRFVVWCPRRCRIDATLRLGRHGAQLGTAGTRRRGHLALVTIALTRRARSQLRRAHDRPLSLTVLTTASGGYARRVAVSFDPLPSLAILVVTRLL